MPDAILLPPAQLELHDVADQIVERVVAQCKRKRSESRRDLLEQIHDEGELQFFPRGEWPSLHVTPSLRSVSTAALVAQLSLARSD